MPGAVLRVARLCCRLRAISYYAARCFQLLRRRSPLLAIATILRFFAIDVFFSALRYFSRFPDRRYFLARLPAGDFRYVAMPPLDAIPCAAREALLAVAPSPPPPSASPPSSSPPYDDYASSAMSRACRAPKR